MLWRPLKWRLITIQGVLPAPSLSLSIIPPAMLLHTLRCVVCASPRETKAKADKRNKRVPHCVANELREGKREREGEECGIERERK